MALGAPELDFFRSNYLLYPFGFDVIRQPHAALEGYVSATLLSSMTIIEAANVYAIVSLLLNAACAYAFAYEVARRPDVGVVVAIAFGWSSYVAALQLGQFHFLAAWTIPLFALFLRRGFESGRLLPAIACGVCVAVAAYSTFEYVVYLAVFAVVYTVASWRVFAVRGERVGVRRLPEEVFWRGMQTVMVTAAVFVVLSLPLIVQSFRSAARGRFASASSQSRGGLRIKVPLPLTALDRPAVYEHLATIDDNGAVIEVPFGVGDRQQTRGSQDWRLLYHATIHQHPVVGGYVGRTPPGIFEAYEAMPVVGNLLRLSSGGEAVQEEPPQNVPFRYLVLDTATASPELIDFVRSTLDMDLLTASEGKQLYAVQGVKPASLRASRDK